MNRKTFNTVDTSEIDSVIVNEERVDTIPKVFNIRNPEKIVKLNGGYVQVFKRADMSPSIIQSISIEGNTNISDSKLNLNAIYTFSNKYFADSFINFKWERFHNNKWQTIGKDDCYLEQEIDSSWNGDKIRLTEEYNGVTVKSQEQTIIVNNGTTELTTVSISGLKSTPYVVSEQLSLIANPVFSDNNADRTKIKYQWKIQNKDNTLFLSSEQNLRTSIKDINWNGSTITLIVTYNGKSLSTTKTLQVEEPKVISSSISGVNSYYRDGDTLNASLQYEINNTLDITPTKYTWEKQVNGGQWETFSTSKNINVNIDASWKNSKIRCNFVYNGKSYSTREYEIYYISEGENIPEPVSITKVDIEGYKNEYNLNDSMFLQAKVTLSNGQWNTGEVGYLWQISRKTLYRSQEWQTISTTDSLNIHTLDETYIGCSIRFIPSLNSVADNSKTVNVINDFQFGITQQPPSVDPSINQSQSSTGLSSTTLIIIIVCSILLLLIILAIAIFLIIKRKKEKEIESKYRTTNPYGPTLNRNQYRQGYYNRNTRSSGSLPVNGLRRNPTLPSNDYRTRAPINHPNKYR